MGQISRVTTFVNGQPPFSDDLNGEMNQIASTGNNLDNDNFVEGADISETKLAPTLAGSGFDIASGVLSLNTDDSTLETSADALQVKNLGITAAKLATNSVAAGKILDGQITRVKQANELLTPTSLSVDVDLTTTYQQIYAGVVTTTGRSVLVAAYGNCYAIDGGVSANAVLLDIDIQFRRGASFAAASVLATEKLFYRIGATVAETRTGLLRAPFCIFFVDSPAAGSYFYRIGVRTTRNATIVAGTKFFCGQL